MIHQRVKDLCFAAARPLALLNHYRYRIFPPRAKGFGYALHIGCGDKYLDGFLNIDANPFRKLDMWLDLRNGLPFKSDSVEFVYAFHTVEHLCPDELEGVLSECRRVLKTGGGMRVVVPNLRTSIQAYVQGHGEWFGDWPRSCRSLGGRFTNYLFCDGQHRAAFDFGYLEELLLSAEFSSVKERKPMESEFCKPDVLAVCEQESDPDLPRSVYVEAVK
jgi:prepilin-type processing-associated H-X9-DG protein